MRTFFIIPILCSLALIAGGVFISGLGFGTYLDMASLVIVVCPVLFLLMTHYSFKEIGHAFFLAMKKSKSNISETKQAIILFKTMFNLLIFSGISGTFLGIIGILADVKNPENIGRWLAAAFLALFYSVLLIGVIAIPFKSALEKKLCDYQNDITQ